ncbi:MAG: YfhO family protein, partial [Bacteroidia bacterium]|nr:YfhO family protein [Bacteroidia bacterium]
IYILTAVVGGFCLLCYVAPEMVNTFQAEGELEEMVDRYVRAGYPEDQARPRIVQLMPQIEIARIAIFKSDALRSLVFILLGFLALYLYFTNKIKREIFLAVFGFFILVDLWTVDRRYINDQSFVSKAENDQRVAGKTDADEEILKDTTLDYRVLNLTVGPFDDASTSYYHKSIGGYHGAKLRRYVDLIEFHLRPEINILYKDISKAAANDSSLSVLFSRLRVLNMLNTRYFILPAGEDGNSAVPLKNPVANGNAWFIRSLKSAASPDSEIVGLKRIDTKTEAIVNTSFKQELGLKDTYDANGTIKMLSYKPNDLVYETENKSEGFAVFSEIYYKSGWNAYVDGELKPHAQVNYVLRGMTVPAGKHKIEFKFEPKTYYTGNSIAMVGSILLLITVAGGIYLERRNKVIVS